MVHLARDSAPSSTIGIVPVSGLITQPLKLAKARLKDAPIVESLRIGNIACRRNKLIELLVCDFVFRDFKRLDRNTPARIIDQFGCPNLIIPRRNRDPRNHRFRFEA